MVVEIHFQYMKWYIVQYIIWNKHDYATIDGKQIMEVTETKFLGISIYDKNIGNLITYTSVKKKVAKHNGIILKARHVINFNYETLFTVYLTIAYPYLNYCVHLLYCRTR